MDIEGAFRSAYVEFEAMLGEPIVGSAERYVERYILWPSLYSDEGGES